MKIEELTDFSITALDAINGLLPQLSPSVVVLEESDLRNIVDSESTKLFLAIDEDGVFGMLSLVLFRIPTGRKAWVEDVVVDEKARGRGVGKLLTEHAIQVAREHGAHSVDLTSRPSREAANALYQRVGFEQRVTNVYRFQAS
jgi:ribosomal protein S18 acetylase RimI-like enzyme